MQTRFQRFLHVNRPTHKISLRAPIVAMVLAATAIPVELRWPGGAEFSFGSDDVFDVFANIAGYIPVGIALEPFRPFRGVLAAALVSAFAETSQLAMVHRDPSLADVIANTIGAILGTALAGRFGIRSLDVGINKKTSLLAAALALLVVFGVWSTSGPAPNPRGLTLPGQLEAHWTFDDKERGVALDSSANRLHGRFRNEPARTGGVAGSAVMLDGRKDFIDVGRNTPLRLNGSMTVTAWIKPTSFPVDDAAIVSQFDSGFGYQLDTTVDRGPRTIGFKLTNACGDLMARYGTTPLAANVWHHVAGVYDAEKKALDVYLNGELDNGFLLGSITATQRSSRAPVYLGRRTDREGYEFAGSLDDVRIYSIALTSAEIDTVMRGSPVVHATERDGSRQTITIPSNCDEPCAVSSEPYDKHIPIAAAAIGVLAAIGCIGLCPNAKPLVHLVVSFAAGVLLLPISASALPSFNLLLIPLVSLGAGASVALGPCPPEGAEDWHGRPARR